MTATAYPLHWPASWKRTKSPQQSAFKSTQWNAQRGLLHEIKLMGGNDVVLSTNVELRLDGLPYASRRPPEDKGVAVYFKYNTQDMVFACDQWNSITDNMRAIEKTISALRGIERWGASDMMERAFTGFTALPAPDAEKHWTVIFGLSEFSNREQINQAYRQKAKASAANERELYQLNAAKEQAFREVNI